MYRQMTQLTAVLMIVLGVIMWIVTLSRGVGVGLILGTLFIVAGAGRLFILRRRGP